jgi:hypothetical protein
MLQSYVDAAEGGALHSRRLNGCRVVELGAGCGVAGMALALRGAQVTFTDKEDMMAHCRDNVTQNLESTPHWQRVRFAPFLWGTDARATLEPPYDIVLATDPFVLHETRTAFVHALRAVSGPTSLVVIVFQVGPAHAQLEPATRTASWSMTACDGDLRGGGCCVGCFRAVARSTPAWQVREQAVFDQLLDGLTAGGFEWEHVHARRLARACQSTGYSGVWCPMVLARRAPGSAPPDLDAAELPAEEVTIASAAAEPGFTTAKMRLLSTN